MERPELLVLVVVTTAVGGLLVGWTGVLALNVSAWLPTVGRYLTVALVSAVLLLLVWIWVGRTEQV